MTRSTVGAATAGLIRSARTPTAGIAVNGLRGPCRRRYEDGTGHAMYRVTDVERSSIWLRTLPNIVCIALSLSVRHTRAARPVERFRVGGSFTLRPRPGPQPARKRTWRPSWAIRAWRSGLLRHCWSLGLLSQTLGFPSLALGLPLNLQLRNVTDASVGATGAPLHR